jgi:hypothetical protein
VRRIDQSLGIRDIMQGRDRPVLYTDSLMYHFHDRRETVGRTRCGGDDAIFCRVVEVVIDTHHHVQHLVDLDRCGNNHPLGTSIEVALQGRGCQKLAGALKHDVHTQAAPVNVGSTRMRRKSKSLVIDPDR